jgi:1-acyl-sn-glycerol-3-phosphate acyltransferase
MINRWLVSSMPAPKAAAPQRLPRIPARKTPPGELAIWLLARAALRRMFVRLRVSDAGAFALAAGMPLLAVANHPSWWDGYIALALSRHYGRARYLMMDEAQLRRYPFFAWAGCFSVDRHDPRETARSLAYAANLLATERAPLVWLFPQGEIVPPDAWPLTVQSGAGHILRRVAASRAPVGVLPVAWQLVFRGEQHPEVFVRVLPAFPVSRSAACDVRPVNACIAERLTAALEALQADLRAGSLAAYRTILRGRIGVNDHFDRLSGRTRLVPDA